MAPKPSRTSQRATELAVFIRSKIATGVSSLSQEHSDDVVNLRALLWRRLTKEEQAYVVLSVTGDTLNISIYRTPKTVRPENKFKSLLRRAMLHVDDEKLYDEIMEAVHGK